jgi:hypothetical protein
MMILILCSSGASLVGWIIVLVKEPLMQDESLLYFRSHSVVLCRSGSISVGRILIVCSSGASPLVLVQEPFMEVDSKFYLVPEPFMKVDSKFYIVQEPFMKVDSKFYIVQEPIMEVESRFYIVQEPSWRINYGQLLCSSMS